ncbi:MAG: cytochrome c3 family protein [Phaeovulum sp.]|uniref:multiheme c-type cytochrome n=1 Tax=Phaeovulum sp. TaxID=2934796 RepID=UPI00272F9F0E|nr:cytochrome c3 family protein [Phaeovulum sp.]MDP2063412.1 cytochrome c3 family protein [Phaeovulum sp.]
MFKITLSTGVAMLLATFGPAGAEPLVVAEELKACIECHSGTTEIGQQILSAKAGWAQSVHANGQRQLVFDSASHQAIGFYWGGSMSSMGNGSSCQVCHTNEGFLNRLAGKYDSPEAVAAEVLAHPSPIGCSTCHTPHQETNFAVLTVPSGTPVHNGINATYDKPEGSICVSCHSVRLMDGRVATFDTTIDRIMNSLKSDFALNAHFGPHYGGEADVLVGANGAEYAGREYPDDSTHSVDPKSNCVSCHMPLRTDMMSHLSAGLGNHSFEITAPLRGSMAANLGGCESCHDIVKRDLTTYSVPVSDGYLVAGSLYFQDAKDWLASTDSATVKLEIPKQPARLVSDILVRLADPDQGCSGLLKAAYDKVTGSQNGMSFANDGHERCVISGYGRDKLPAATSETDPSARLLKAIWNFALITEGDASMGLHNLNYTLRLLYDSCADLNDLVGGADLKTACNDPEANRP